MLKINTDLLPAKLLYFFYFGAVGALWPFIPVIARQYSVQPLAVGLIFAAASFLFLPCLFLFLLGFILPVNYSEDISKRQTGGRSKSHLGLIILINIALAAGLGVLHGKLQNEEKSVLQRPVTLLCDGKNQHLFLRHCEEEGKGQNCFQIGNNDKYFDKEYDVQGDEWRQGKDVLKDRSSFEFCDVRCSVANSQGMCDLFEDPEECRRGEGVEHFGNLTLLKFEMRVEVAKIQRNASCTVLPLHLISFDGKRLWSSCPFPTKSGASEDLLVLESCFVDCPKNKHLNRILDDGQVGTLGLKSSSFWILVLFSGFCVVTVSLGIFLVDYLLVEQMKEMRRSHEVGPQRLWGLLGWGIVALICGYTTDYSSEDKPVKDYSTCFYLACGLFFTSACTLLFWKVKERIPKDVSLVSLFSTWMTETRNLVSIFACVIAGFCYALQFSFYFWFMEEVSEEEDHEASYRCDLKECMKLAQGLAVVLESVIPIPLYLFSVNIMRSVFHGYLMSGALIGLGLRYLIGSVMTTSWALVPVSILNGHFHGLFFLALLSNCLILTRSNRGVNVALVLLPAILAGGIGFGAGSVISGVLMETQSSRLVFRIFGGIAVISGLIHLALSFFLFPKASYESRTLSYSEELNEDDIDGTESEEMMDRKGKDVRKPSKAETLRSSSTVEWKEASGTSSMKKFKLLLWKNFKIQTRHKFQTVVEIIIPLIFTFALALIRIMIPIDKITEPTLFQPFTLKDNVPAVLRTLTNQIYYTPSQNAFVEEIIDGMKEDFFYSQGLNYSFLSFPTEEKLIEAYDASMVGYSGLSGTTSFNATSNVLAGIVFPKLTKGKVPAVFQYELKFPAFQRSEFDLFSERFTFKPSWYSEGIYPLFRLPGPRSKNNEGGFPGYFAEGFLFLQNAVESTVTKLLVRPEQKEELEEYNIQMQRFPYPTYTNDNFIFASQFWMAYFLTLSFIYPAMNIAKMIVHEKEGRIKEFMKMMGLPNWLHWTAWFIKTFLYLIVTLICLTILMKIEFEEDRAILTEANSLVLFVVFIFHAISLIGFCFFMSTLFSDANSAATATGFLWLLMFMPYGFLFPRINTMSRQTKYMTSFLLGNSPLTYACYIMSTFEGTGAGIHWGNIGEGVTPDDSFCVLDCIIMMIVNAVTYSLAAFYVELAWPGKYGVPLPWYFPFTKWYWTGGIPVDKLKRTPSFTKRGNMKSTYFESDPTHLKVGIDIKGLTKAFGDKTAVNSLSLRLFENQITALLGHNGAGKTTTMSMLTGIITPTRGTAVVNEHDICNDMRAVRASLGMCPQYNVLFDELTVQEHLYFFSLLKGYSKEEAELEVERMLAALGFEDKRNAQAHTLSGGMKRKLSVGIAFCAGSKAVLLDEPTSGMDVGARRSTWDLIQMEKLGRTVILSTHFMEEADLLGDRIAIMSEGTVRCCGSSLFLKKKYGGDYRLIIVKEPDCIVSNVTAVLKSRIPTVDVSEDVGAELTYSLPADSTGDFPGLFEELEDRKEELRIASYGVGNTSMEEVFMRAGELPVNHHGQSNHGPKKSQSLHTIKSESSFRSMKNSRSHRELLMNGPAEEEKLQKKMVIDGPRNTGITLIMQQMKAMLKKKFLYSVRNRSLAILQVGIPVALLSMAILAFKTVPGIKTPEPHLITLDRYQTLGETFTAVSCERDQIICRGYRDFVQGKNYNMETIKGVSFLDYILDKETEDVGKATSQYIVGFEQRSKSLSSRKPTELVALFNNQPFHTPPLALNFLHNGILKAFGVKTELSVTNYPFDYNSIDKLKQTASFFTIGFMAGWIIQFGLAFQAASFIIFPVDERVTNAKHLQFVAGLKYPVYWTANFLMDVFNYMIPCVLMGLLLLAFDIEEFKSWEVFITYLILCVCHSWSMIPQMSLFSFAFTIPSSGYARMTVLHAATGLISMLIVIILDVPEFNIGDITSTLHNVFMIFPNYALGMAVVQITSYKDLKEFCGDFNLESLCQHSSDFVCCTRYQDNIFAWQPFGVGKNILAMLLWGFFCVLGVILIESRLVHKLMAIFQWNNDWERGGDSNSEEEPLDDDVAKESQRINSQTLSRLSKRDNLILRNLTKVYDNNLTAVDSLTLGVRRGETFGLLGVNGAGKTTTFKMLTGDIPVTSGDAYLCQHSVRKTLAKVYENLGYCPQFDAVIEQLTGRETIRMFANLKGIQDKYIDKIINTLAENLLFTQHIDKQVGEYSGGNKRKLSTALAMLGNPPIVFLDEPSTGMDPVARRHVWTAISKLRELETSVVITSHSMEECEALCTRLSIMVGGRFQCLGSSQHLKNKFGEGYTVVAQLSYSGIATSTTPVVTRSHSVDDSDEDETMLRPWELELSELKEYIETEFPGCELKDTHPGFVQYFLPGRNVKWAKLFAVMETAKDKFNLEAYSVGQTSLEQVFFNFTKLQKSEDD